MARRKPRYISGHCAGNSRGGHDRCKVVCEGHLCRCSCHFDQLGVTSVDELPLDGDDEMLEDDSGVVEAIDVSADDTSNTQK